MDPIKYFNHLVETMDSFPPSSIYNLYITKAWVPIAQKYIKEGLLPSDTKIIIVPDTLSSISTFEVLEKVSYKKKEQKDG